MNTTISNLRRVLSRALRIETHELVPALVSALYFFCVLCSYYLVRPLREQLGIARGAGDLWWIILITLGVMFLATPAFGALAQGRSRRVFIPAVYRFFGLSFLLFLGAMLWGPEEWRLGVGYGFFVWVSVFNLFVVSLFWALMADGFRLEQSKRLFGFVAIGGSVGASLGSGLSVLIAGPVTHWLYELVGNSIPGITSEALLSPAVLVLGSIMLLEAATQCVRFLAPRFVGMKDEERSAETWAEASPPAPRAASDALPPASMWRGFLVTIRSPYLLATAGYLFLYAVTSTFLYLQQGHIVADSFEDRNDQIAYFASIDLWVNLLTLGLQLFVTGRIMATFGIAATLAFLPFITLVGFLYLGYDPTIGALAVVIVLRKAGNYAVSRPARETLFTVVPRDAKYQGKTFIDTFVYRVGDGIGAGIDKLLRVAEFSVTGVAFMTAPLAILWLALAVYLGRRQRALAASANGETSGA